MSTAVKNVSRSRIPYHVAEHDRFEGSNIRGIVPPSNPQFISTGRLSQAWVQRMIADDPTYVVISYGTPIAWVPATGGAVIPAESYSTTTSAHQSLAAEGLTGDRKTRHAL